MNILECIHFLPEGPGGYLWLFTFTKNDVGIHMLERFSGAVFQTSGSNPEDSHEINITGYDYHLNKLNRRDFKISVCGCLCSRAQYEMCFLI